MSIITDTLLVKLMNRDFVIYPAEKESITPLGYDLRVGCAINLTKDSHSEDGSVIIPPKNSCFIVTKEHVWLSGSIVGTLHSLGSFAAKGLIMNSTTVDPNWKGQMTFLIYNSTEFPAEIKIDSPFVTLVLHRAEASTDNEPLNNPISVAHNYGNLYGERFSNGLNSYLVSSENNAVKKIFEKSVDSAKQYSALKSIFFSIVSSSKKPFSNLRSFFILFFSLLLAPVISAQWYWTYVQPLFNGIEYDSKVLAAQAATFVGICALIVTLTIKK